VPLSKKITFLTLFFLQLFLQKFCLAADDYKMKDGFYKQVDPTKVDTKRGYIDRSVSLDSKVSRDRYYGYKLGDKGLFVAPELFVGKQDLKMSGQNSTTSAGASGANSRIKYDLKANIGYEFMNDVSGFVVYDVGSVSYDKNQKAANFTKNAPRNSAVGIGSQVEISDDFSVKLIYSQQTNNGLGASGPAKTENVKFGTSYAF
jgi:hypothetical protein